MSHPTRRLYEVRAAWLPNEPIIGRLSMPVRPAARSGSAAGAVVSSSALPSFAAFEYDAEWLENGFSIGGDVPLTRGVHLPALGKQLFGFLEDRAVSASNYVVFASGEKPDGRLPDDASPAENAAVILPDRRDAFGGLRIVPTAGEAPESLPRLVRSTMLDDLVYAFHTFERGRMRERETAVLRRALTLPGERPVFTMERARECQTVRLRGMNDSVDRPLWVGIALETASRCGIKTVTFDCERELGETVLFSRRVDRAPEKPGSDGPAVLPMPVFSGAALTAKPAGSSRVRALPAGYLALADILNREGAAPAKDLPHVFRRMVFALLTGAGTDSLRRWLFVREALGWRLLPAHTLEWPMPGQAPRGGLTLDGKRRLGNADDATLYAPYFGLTVSEAKMTVLEMRRVLMNWESIAADMGADAADIALMTPSLELY